MRVRAEPKALVEVHRTLDAVEDQLGMLLEVGGAAARAIDPANAGVGGIELTPGEQGQGE